MEGYELLAVVVFFLIGYWIVDYFWPRKKAAEQAGIAVPAPADAAPWHEVLGVPPDANEEQIREAYLKKSAEHHPDRVFNQGLEAREAAIKMTRKINDAFEEATRAKR